MADIDIYNLLKGKLGDAEAKTLVSWTKENDKQVITEVKNDMADVRVALKEEILDQMGQELKGLATKEDLIREIANVRTELKEDIASVRTELKDVRTELKEGIANTHVALIKTKVELIKWMVGLLVAFAALIITVMNFMLK